MIQTVELYDEREAVWAMEYLLELGYLVRIHSRVKYWLDVKMGDGPDPMYDLGPDLDKSGFRWDWV